MSKRKKKIMISKAGLNAARSFAQGSFQAAFRRDFRINIDLDRQVPQDVTDLQLDIKFRGHRHIVNISRK
jgi:hypothetical protein